MVEVEKGTRQDENDVSARLRNAFLEDHRIFTRGLQGIMDVLRRGDDERAIELARELDANVGAHIEFEEHHFYPLLRGTYGREFVGRLYAEHDVGRSAIRSLISCGQGEQLPQGMRERIVEQLETAHQHALSCGSLLSHIERLDVAEQERTLDALLECRAKGARWTE